MRGMKNERDETWRESCKYVGNLIIEKRTVSVVYVNQTITVVFFIINNICLAAMHEFVICV